MQRLLVNLLVAALTASALPRGSVAQPTKYAAFWAWFSAQSAHLLRVDGGGDPALDSLAAALHRVAPELTFELGPRQPGRPRELVLSADGIRKAFPEVEALYAAAPAMADWKVIKFHPRRAMLDTLTVGGEQFDPHRTRFLLIRDEPGKVGILLFWDNYAESRRDLFAQAGFLLLDQALGEYDLETRVGAVDFFGADSQHFPRSRPLIELATTFDAYFGTTRR